MEQSARKYGPAAAMAVGIIGAIALLILLPFNLTGSWNEKQGEADPWERVRAEVLDEGFAERFGPEVEIDPETLTLLERTDHGAMLWAAETTEGGLITGILGGGASGGAATSPASPEVSVGFGQATEESPAYFVWVQRAPTAESGYRHRLLEFPDNEAMSTYMASLDG